MYNRCICIIRPGIIIIFSDLLLPSLPDLAPRLLLRLRLCSATLNKTDNNDCFRSELIRERQMQKKLKTHT